ncbi:unnamed protein product, partial [Amoebophrya sp. A25]
SKSTNSEPTNIIINKSTKYVLCLSPSNMPISNRTRSPTTRSIPRNQDRQRERSASGVSLSSNNSGSALGNNALLNGGGNPPAAENSEGSTSGGAVVEVATGSIPATPSSPVTTMQQELPRYFS